ncbi:phosphatase PAP2 family protein [Nocardioides sp. 31GB23]|uniref:phosphatase PAP2 family protein n=1 Tax=Nocardioides sp. 31GB23 TaxID=3156065 RepID=UPI0032AECD2D
MASSLTGTAPETVAAPTTGRTRRLPRALAVAAWATALVAWSSTLGIPNDTVQVFVWLWLGTIAWDVEAPARHHLRFLRDWSLPMLGLVVYFYSRGLTDELGLPVHWTMPIRVDEWLGGGTTPTEHLQAAWCGRPCLRAASPSWYDVVLTTVYASHFLVGLSLAAVLWVRDRAAWARWMRRYLMICFGALVVYVLYPMAPPWMASREGLMGEVTRLTGRGWDDLGIGRLDLVLQGVGNPVAAMPSLHAGIAFLVAVHAVQRLGSPWRWLLLGYPALMSLALVYFAEHYVVDIVAGAVLALAVVAVAAMWERQPGVGPEQVGTVRE